MRLRERWAGPALWVAGALLFVVLATANAAGYRYGVSDQAFYVPAVVRALNPAAFPHDAPLIEAQARLMVLDELIARIVAATGLSIESVFALGYFASLLIIWTALTLIGGSLYRSAWMTAALAAAFTLRHRIPRTSANSFEAYFHPRMLAFGFGALAVAALLRRRPMTSIALVGVTALVHITTGIWFAVLLGVAIVRSAPRLRPAMTTVVAIGLAAAGWTITAGPLSDGLVRMDATWRQAVASKDSLFPNEWPLWAWVANLGLVVVLVWAYAMRRRRAEATAEDEGLVAGALALTALFLVTLPAVAAGVAVAVQLQISRVFWLVDLLATMYVVGLVGNGRATATRALAALLFVASVARGAYIIEIEHPERTLFAFDEPASPWIDITRWLASQPLGVNVLADPGHAWKYGTSVRVSAARDVFLEDVKDSALAMYSRPIATRVLERAQALGDFSALTGERARELAARYDLDYLVTPAALNLPLAYRNAQFSVYALR
ncbi:MAG TPA: hypothetical protein VGQ10_09905 [Vicinamibacterales bacterium]|nr:hypothetical protein [Vicinamibacterales bacterium]